jgi:hypothetical protein
MASARLRQTLFVDVHDDDPLVHRFGHRGAQAGVVDDVVEPLQHADVRDPARMQQGKKQRNQCDRDPGPVSGEPTHPAATFDRNAAAGVAASVNQA